MRIKTTALFILLLRVVPGVQAQDSVFVKIHPSYGRVSGFSRWLLGENYRKEWSMEVRLPVLHMSSFSGGLAPEKLGGGMQSKSLRLVDKDGKEWVIRSVEKIPDLVVPEKLRQTFARDLVDDATSAQNPFACLLVPPVADAVHVPHTNPIIGYIAPDAALGQYEKTFSGTAVVLEERAPFKQSDNTLEVLEKLRHNNDNSYDAVTYLKARMIDLLLADWDRHEDQWRWHASDNGAGKTWVPIPRDRDQVVSVTEGVLPHLVKGLYTLPRVPGFTEKIRKPRHYFFKSAFVNSLPASQFNHEEWMAIVRAFVESVTDSVLEASLRKLPAPVYALRHDVFLRDLKARRDQLPGAMEDYYRFINEIVDVRLSDKGEFVELADTAGGTRLSVFRGGDGQLLMSKFYPASVTKEIRVYAGDGNDSFRLRRDRSGIKIRVITGEGNKVFSGEGRGVQLYGRTDNVSITGNGIRRHLSNDSVNTAYSPVNLYSLTFPLVNAGVNADDGFLLGGGFRYLRQKGFRKEPYSSSYQLMLTHSFSTNAFKVNFRSEWIKVFGNADITLQADVNAPKNTVNFFGLGNETIYIKEAGLKYYRARFKTYELAPALRWRWDKKWSVSVGPALQYYNYEPEDNVGRFITHQSLIGSYDSASVDDDKLHLGGRFGLYYDSRNNLLLPTMGVHAVVDVKAYKATGNAGRDYGQVSPELGFYVPLNGAKTFVIGNRTGGVVSVGNPAFYQSAFLGGQGNLLGFRQYRFAGRHAFYNNFEARVKLADVSSYILPGELGLAGFFDVGRVWAYNDQSDTWHNGVGGGVYYVPAQLAVFRLMAGHSVEGWYPYISLGIRF